MKTLGVRELKLRMSEALRLIAKGETIEITKRGEVVAHLVPIRKAASSPEATDDDAWAELDRLSAEISAHWPAGLSAVDAVRDARREL